jgi:hypothetical protein
VTERLWSVFEADPAEELRSRDPRLVWERGLLVFTGTPRQDLDEALESMRAQRITALAGSA